ncbi:AAA family ATPase [Chelatococcus daeguensis]|uniref:AAA family ATPase n=1 Tax=Chelatococcus daeguensis TaxID=444444 RepID=UPI0007AC24EA|nr:AAA family ATPase [Chelatococcus daeguensis]KZE30599.1 ATPase [Chelatococcus daeguensis]MBM3081950.1 AAA family ATPase [Chelatococcus daeguensis]
MANDATDRFFVLTGGPGSGKTTLLAALAAAGHTVSPEAGRAIIRNQQAIGGPALPSADPALYAELMLAHDLAAHRRHLNGDGLVFFDRGIPDIAGYLDLVGLARPAHLERAIACSRYNRRVFICPPWPEIFTQDAERRQTLEEAERTHAAMVRIYDETGYDLIEVPRLPTAERAAFILASSA